jgi:hypothetical protein
MALKKVRLSKIISGRYSAIEGQQNHLFFIPSDFFNHGHLKSSPHKYPQDHGKLRDTSICRTISLPGASQKVTGATKRQGRLDPCLGLVLRGMAG